MTFGFGFFGSRLGTCDALVVIPIRSLTGRLIEPSIHLVQSPFKVFTFGKCFPEMALLFLEKLRIAQFYNSPSDLMKSIVVDESLSTIYNQSSVTGKTTYVLQETTE